MLGPPTTDVQALPPVPARAPETGAAETYMRHVLLGCVLSLVLTTVLSVVDYIPTNDGPNTVVNGYLTLHLDDPHKGYAHFLESNPNPTSRAFELPFCLLLRVLPWQDALRVTLSLGALAWSWGFFALLLSLQPKRLSLFPLGFATALCWPLYMGFYSYWLSTALALWVLAACVAVSRWNARRHALLAAGLLVVAIGHSFVAALLGMFLVALTATRSRPHERVRALAWLGLSGVPAALLTLLAAAGASVRVADASVQALPPNRQLALWERLALPARCFTAGPAWRAATPVVLALLALALFAWPRRRAAATGSERGLCIAALVSLALSVALPFDLRLWSCFSPRLVPLAVLIGCALLPVESLPRRRWHRAVVLASSGFALAALAWSASYQLQLADYEADAIALSHAKLKRSGARLPLKLTPPFGGMAYGQVGVNLPLLYVMDQGGMVPDLFATRAGLHPHMYRAPRKKLFPRTAGRFYGEIYRRAGSAPSFPPKPVQWAWLALLGSAYEDVILIAEPEVADSFEARGYVADARRGTAAILRYRGCGMRVAINGASPTRVPLRVEYGWSPVLTPAAVRTLPPGFTSGSLAFPRAPCGRVWVRVAWDEDRDGEPSSPDHYCQHANALHLIEADVRTRDQIVTCTAPP